MIMEIFNNGNYKYISKMIEERLPLLRKNEDFNKMYLRLSDTMEELEKTLSEKQKVQFNEIVQLFYKTEDYFFILSYSLGVKYGKDLKNL